MMPVAELVLCAVVECKRPAIRECKITVQLVHQSGFVTNIETCTCRECYQAFPREQITAMIIPNIPRRVE